MSEIIRINRQFEGIPLATYVWDGKPCWIAKDVGKAMGYSDEGRGLLVRIGKDWKDEFIEGHDFEMLDGERLKNFVSRLVTDSVTSGSTMYEEKGDIREFTSKWTAWMKGSPIHPSTPRLLLLWEPGFHGCCLKTDKPGGKRLRRWLREDVLPSIYRTGIYAKPDHHGTFDPTQAASEIFSEAAPRIMVVLADKAEKGSIQAARLLMQYQTALSPKLAPSSTPSSMKSPGKTELDVMEEKVSAYLQSTLPAHISGDKLLKEALGIKSPLPGQRIRLGHVMNRLGWRRRKEIEAGERNWRYLPPLDWDGWKN